MLLKFLHSFIQIPVGNFKLYLNLYKNGLQFKEKHTITCNVSLMHYKYIQLLVQTFSFPFSI